jgi:hypothetical protein
MLFALYQEPTKAILYQELMEERVEMIVAGSLVKGRVSLLYDRVRIKLTLFSRLGHRTGARGQFSLLRENAKCFLPYFGDLGFGPTSQWERRSEGRS